MMNRRFFLTGLTALIAAPAIVRATSLMPIKAIPAWEPVLDNGYVLRPPAGRFVVNGTINMTEIANIGKRVVTIRDVDGIERIIEVGRTKVFNAFSRPRFAKEADLEQVVRALRYEETKAERDAEFDRLYGLRMPRGSGLDYAEAPNHWE